MAGASSMPAALFRNPSSLGRKWKALRFPATGCRQIALSSHVDEETNTDYIAARFYPTTIGQVLHQRYQVEGKLGYGASSTVWLARDLKYDTLRSDDYCSSKHVVLKMFVSSRAMGVHLDDELKIYERIAQGPSSHPGFHVVRRLLDSFDVDGPFGQHRCLVHTPLHESLLDFLHRNPIRRLPPPVLAFTLQRLFLALDYLHNECNVIHTDIRANNIMFEVDDPTVFEMFEQEEVKHPSPRKISEGRTIYKSRPLQRPKGWGAPVLCDFGSAVDGREPHTEDVQPDVYRSPEVILEVPWSYKIDIWNVGAMVWDLFEGGHLFTGLDPELREYRSRAHLAEMVALLGPPPVSLLAEGSASSRFFNATGGFVGGIPLPESRPLTEREENLKGEDQQRFLALMGRMLQWDPRDRAGAAELVEHEWILDQLREK